MTRWQGSSSSLGLKPYCGQVVGAKDGQDGLEKFKKQGFDIVMSDIHMPVLNGFEMMNEIKKAKTSSEIYRLYLV